MERAAHFLDISVNFLGNSLIRRDETDPVGWMVTAKSSEVLEAVSGVFHISDYDTK